MIDVRVSDHRPVTALFRITTKKIDLKRKAEIIKEICLKQKLIKNENFESICEEELNELE